MITIGLLATLTGPYTVPGEDAVRGAQLALIEFDDLVQKLGIELQVRSTNAIGSSATHEAETLLDKDGADVIVGPLSGDEGIAIRDLALTRPDHVFLNGTSGSQEANLWNPAPNFYFFNPTGAQWIAGLGEYIYIQGLRRVVTVGEAYSFPYSQIAAFNLEFCNLGGHVPQMLWCALGQQDYTEIIAQIPDDVDAVFSTLGGSNGVRFLQQYHQQGGQLPILGGTIFADQSMFHGAKFDPTLLTGILSASPIADDNPDPNWQRFVTAYKLNFPDGFSSPSMFAFCYYVNMKALLLGLQAVDGDLSNGQAALKAALDTLAFDTPSGPTRLDHNRVAIADIFVTELKQAADGHCYTHMLFRREAVNNTLGINEADYKAMGPFNRNKMPCGHRPKTFEEILEERRRNQTS